MVSVLNLVIFLVSAPNSTTNGIFLKSFGSITLYFTMPSGHIFKDM